MSLQQEAVHVCVDLSLPPTLTFPCTSAICSSPSRLAGTYGAGDDTASAHHTAENPDAVSGQVSAGAGSPPKQLDGHPCQRAG